MPQKQLKQKVHLNVIHPGSMSVPISIHMKHNNALVVAKLTTVSFDSGKL